MIAVSEVDRMGGLIILAGVAFIAACSLLTGVVQQFRVRAGSSPQGRTDTCQAPAPRPVTVEPGNFSPADSTHREGVAGSSPRRPSAGEAIETLTIPGPYSQIGNRR